MAGDPNSAFPWLTRDLYRRAYRRAFLYAYKLKHPRERVTDLVNHAFLRALDPDDKPWRPGMTPDFASHVCDLVYSAHGNYVKSYAHLHVVTFAAPNVLVRRDPAHEPKGAEEALDDARAARLAEARYTRLEARIEGDPLVVLLLDGSDGRTSSDRALAHGYSLEDVRLARARLKRHIEAVVREMPSRTERETEPSP